MNNTIRPTAQWFKVGVVLVLAIGMLGMMASLAVAQQLLPNGVAGPNGVINHVCPDAYDAGVPTDDLQANASTLTAGTLQQHNFDGNTNLGIADKDWAKFQVVRTAVYTITTIITPSLSTQTDTVLQLYDVNGNLLAENDDAPGTTNLSSRITWTAPTTASGWYYVEVTNNPKTPTANPANCSTVLSYTLSLQSKVPLFLYLPLVMRNF
jgi:pre-peptidase